MTNPAAAGDLEQPTSTAVQAIPSHADPGAAMPADQTPHWSQPPLPPASYTGHPGLPVWVWRQRWCPGRVLAGSSRAVLVEYRATDGPAISVDTVLPRDLAKRHHTDPYLDAIGAAVNPTTPVPRTWL